MAYISKDIQMTKYFIFVNEPNTQKSNAPGSAEMVACEIACALGMDGFPANHYIAYPHDTAEATFGILKEQARFSIELDDAKLDIWRNEVEPLLEKITESHDVLSNAYGQIYDCAHELESAFESSEHFSDLNPASELNIDRAYEYLENPSEYEMLQRVEEMFDFKLLVPSSV